MEWVTRRKRKEKREPVLNESQREMEITKIETKISKTDKEEKQQDLNIKTLTNINKTIFSPYMSFQHKLVI